MQIPPVRDEKEQLCKAVDIVLQLCEAFIGREEGIKPQLFKDVFQEHMGEEPGMAETVRAALLYGEAVVFCLSCGMAVGFKSRDQGGSCLKGFLEALHIAGLPVIKAVQRADIEDDLLLRDLFACLICDPDGLDQA